MPMEFAVSGPFGLRLMRRMCNAQLGHCSIRERYSHATFNDASTINCRRINVTMTLGATSFNVGFVWKGYYIRPHMSRVIDHVERPSEN